MFNDGDERIRALLIEDNPADARLIRELLNNLGYGSYRLDCVARLSDGLKCLERERFDVILLDLSLPDSQGLGSFLKVHHQAPDVPIMVLTGFDDETLAVRAVQEGAQDYLVKGHVDCHLLGRAIRYAIERKKTEETLRRARDELEARVQARTSELARTNGELQIEIAERKRVEEALRASQQMLRLVMDNIPQAIYWKDRDLVYQGCNRTFATAAGLDTPEAIAGKTDRDLSWTQPQAECIRQRDRRVMDADAPEYHLIEPYMVPGGRQVWLETNRVTLHDGAGGVVGILGTFEDISARKTLEAFLAEERHILEMVATGHPLEGTLAALTGMIERLTVDSICSVLVLDEQRERLHYISAPNLPPEYRSAVDGLIVGPAAGSSGSATYWGETVIVEDTWTDPRWENFRDLVLRFGFRSCWSVPIRDSGNQILGSFTLYSHQHLRPSEKDLQLVETAAHLAAIAIERHRAQEALRGSAEKIKLFAYSISHDLKSPVVGLYGLTRLLAKHYGPLLDERGKHHCDQILKSSEQIAALVEQINLYISAKEAPLVFERIKLTETLQATREEFSTTFGLRGVRWTQPEHLPEIYADRLALLRVLRNLVDNALKYGGDDLSEITIGYADSDEFHTLSIHDDGIGIRQEDSEKIFWLFQRNRTARGTEGTGLGLAIVKEIAEQHGGKVWVESAPDQGTTFYISLSKTLSPSVR